MDGTFQGENYLGTLENGGVGLGISPALADQIPAELTAELEQLAADIICRQALPPRPAKIVAPSWLQGLPGD